MKILVLALLVGTAGGVVAALCGVGGGVIMVPAFVYALGMEHKSAVATSMAVIVPTAVVATSNYYRQDLIDWRVFAGAALGAGVAAYFASRFMPSMEQLTLRRIFGVVMLLMGARMLFPKG